MSLAPLSNTVARSPGGPSIPLDALVHAALADPGELFKLPEADATASAYRGAAPYPHLVIDGFFREEPLRHITREVLGGQTNFTRVFTDAFQRNKTISTGDSVPPLISAIASKFAAPQMLRYLERVTGLRRLIPDPYYNTDYGYYHIVGAGGVLGSHVDHSRHSTLDVPHVLNLVVYLTEDWREQDGGALCLFDKSGKNVVKRVPCLFNRAVLFACTPAAYHGVDPVSPDAGRRRHSLYFAYYSVDTPATGVQEQFPSIHRGGTNLDQDVSYGTYFVVPFTQLFKRENWVHLRIRLVYLAHLVTPPVLMRAVKRIAKAWR